MTDAVSAARAIYDAFAAGDMAGLAAGLADIEWHENEGMPYGGVWHGFGEVAQNVFGPIAADVPDFTAVPDELLPLGDNRAVAFGYYRGHDGKVATPFCHVWTLADGKLVEFRQYADSHLYRQQTGLL
ncbi:MAG TPA: nuclear transport factor 2 family protein [Sphingopyxis sp.]|nr:nuclear transport factor 2 family protein [Sphingopyxis sp.]HMP46721.1 nuclear transport factor 2 family protein [Sphingopyxis sp.]HMQ20613.1 nuclear transport factor 2 family protein [Sphingopyxis sp.]